MATLELCLVVVVFIRTVQAVVKTNAFDLGQTIKDKLSLPGIVQRGTEPGVAMFHQYEDCHFTAMADQGHILHTNQQNDHIDNFTLQFVAFGKRFLLDLHLTRNLFASSYTRKVLHKKGADLKESLHRKEHCYYQGQIRNNLLSHAALSSCDGFRGYVSDGEETYHIDPVNGTLHRLFRNSDRKKLPLKCGTERHDVFHPPPHVFSHRIRKKRTVRGPYDANKFTRFVELYIVNDYRTFDRLGKNATVVFKRSQDIANIVNSLYRQLNIYIVLVGVEVWSTGDKISITSSADTTMENFLRYRKERINPFHTNDNAQLITGIFFDHGVVGKAIKGPICTHQFSGGVSMDYDGLVTLVATTMAHEMGHNFGMEHDNDTKCSCPEDKCIMAATSGQFSPQHWSSCSQNALHEAFELGMDYCLRNPPSNTFDGPVCGNGLVEEGEECDCGLLEDCSNRCCNATACTLYAQAQCGTGRCCDLNTCKPKKPATLCREPTGECDMPEYCDGASEFCPADVYLQDGLSCANGQSYCYKGMCNTHNGQCQLLWGSTGRVSDPICFQQLNLRGNHDGNCGYNWTTDRYQTCERENVMCGLLHCVHLNEKLMFWRDNLALDMRANFLTRGNTQYVCRSTMLDVGLDMPDPGLVPDGAKCEDNKICIKQTCTPLVKLKIAKCPDCHNNGVCNSEGNCHCHIGFAPPLCDRPGYGGSLNSGPATNEYAKRDLLIGLLVLFLVVLPLVTLAFLAYINRERLVAWWKLGPRIKFGVLKKSPSPPPPPQPRLSASFSEKRWSSAPSKPCATLEISGPLLEDPPSYDEFGGRQPLVPGAPSRPIFKPSANKPSVIAPKLNPPAARHSMSSAHTSAVPAVVIAGRDSRTIFGSANSQPAADGAPSKPVEETNRSSRLVHLNNAAADSTLKRQQKAKEGKKAEDRPTQSPPPSPTKGGKKILQSYSVQEPRVGDESVGKEKIVKRESFRGTEISSPILVSTTNRDSQVFADFELDQSGIIARPIGKQHSVHCSKPASEGAQDGSRNPVRRSQSDRPLSPKRIDAASDGDRKSTQPGSNFTPRPLPAEPVVDEDEPLYANEGLSDLDDLKAHISSAFEGFSLNLPSSDIGRTANDKTKDVPKPRTVASSTTSKPGQAASSSVLKKAGQNTPSAPSSVSASTLNSSKPVQFTNLRPTPGSDSATTKANSTTSSKATALERVLNNPIKNPFAPQTTPISSLSSCVSSSGPGKTSSTLTSSGASKTVDAASSNAMGMKPSTTIASSSGPTVRGPFGSAVKKGSDSADGDTKKGSNMTPVSKPTTTNSAARGPLSTVGNKSSTAPSTADKEPSSAVLNKPSTTLNTANKGLQSTALNKQSTIINTNKGPQSAILNKPSTTLNTDNKGPRSTVTDKPSAILNSASKGPQSTALNKPSTTLNTDNKWPQSAIPSTTPNTANKGPQSNAVNKPSTFLNSTSKGPQSTVLNKPSTTLNVANKGPQSTARSKPSSTLKPSSQGPTSVTSKGPASATGRGLANSTANSVSANKFSTVSNKGSASSNSKVSTSSAAAKGPTATNTSRVPGAATSTSSARAQGTDGGSSLNKTGSGASRPSVAPKPGAVKSVRSFNF